MLATAGRREKGYVRYALGVVLVDGSYIDAAAVMFEIGVSEAADYQLWDYKEFGSVMRWMANEQVTQTQVQVRYRLAAASTPHSRQNVHVELSREMLQSGPAGDCPNV